MSAVSGNCERCLKLRRTKWCSGNRDDCAKKLLDTIEAQQQEIERLNQTVGDYGKVASVIALHLRDFCDNELPYNEMIADAARKARVRIEALTADKDELAGRLMRYDTALRQARDALKEIYEHTSCDSIQNGYNASLVMAMAQKALSSTAGQDLLDRLSRAEQREKQLREALQQVGELLGGICIPNSGDWKHYVEDWKHYVEARKLIRSVLEGAE